MNTKEKQDLIELLVKVVTRTFGPEVTPYEKREFGLGAKHTFHMSASFFESCRHGIPQYHIDKALELSQK